MGELTEQELREALQILVDHFSKSMTRGEDSHWESCENLEAKLSTSIDELVRLRKDRDEFIFVQNPMTKKYLKINKTKAVIVAHDLDKPE